MESIFANKRGLITGVFNKQSIAWAIAELIMAEGGTCGFSYMPDKPDDERKKNLGRVSKLTEGNPRAAFLHPMDVTNDQQIAELMRVAGFKLAMEISAYSLIALAHAAREILSDGASILALTYFGGERAVPGYNVMGICKAALDSIVKYLAYDLGPRSIRVNALSPGPLQTISGRGAGVDEMLGLYEAMAPLGRNITHEEAGKCGAFLLSEMSSGITGEILHLDGGYNIMGSPGRLLERIKAAQNS
jgi:enoyl-[acyl-carrier protein] reductase I